MKTEFHKDYRKIYQEALSVSMTAVFRGHLTDFGLNKNAGKLLQPINSPSRYPEYLVFEKSLLQLIQHTAESKILDVSSPKLFSLLLATKCNSEFLLIDPYLPAIEEAQALARSLPEEVKTRIHFSQSYADNNIPFPPSFDNGVDIIFSMSVIEHIEPPENGDLTALEQLTSQLRPNGYLVMSVPVAPESSEEYWDREIYGKKLDSSGRVFFQRIYSAERLKSLIDSLHKELELIHIYSIEHPLNKLWYRTWLNLPDKIRALFGFAFPWMADRSIITDLGSQLPARLETGDAVLVFRNRP